MLQQEDGKTANGLFEKYICHLHYFLNKLRKTTVEIQCLRIEFVIFLPNHKIIKEIL